VQSDADGRFRVDGLARGLAYELVLVTPKKTVGNRAGQEKTVETIILSAGGAPIKHLGREPDQVKDLGTVHLVSRPAD